MQKIQKGFTLIELMIVVAIIGILAAVAIPAYQDYVVKAKMSKVQSTLDPIKLALAMYYQENGSFPNGVTTTATASADGLWTSIGLPNGATMPAEVDPANFVVDGTTGTAVTMALKLRSIKAGTIDGWTITIKGTADKTAVTWACTAAAGGTGTFDPLAQKYFACP